MLSSRSNRATCRASQHLHCSSKDWCCPESCIKDQGQTPGAHSRGRQPGLGWENINSHHHYPTSRGVPFTSRGVTFTSSGVTFTPDPGGHRPQHPGPAHRRGHGTTGDAVEGQQRVLRVNTRSQPQVRDSRRVWHGCGGCAVAVSCLLCSSAMTGVWSFLHVTPTTAATRSTHKQTNHALPLPNRP